MTSQPFPNLQTKVVDQNGNVTTIWRNFFTALYDRTGGSVTNNFVTQSQANLLITDAHQAAGAAIIPITPTGSPFSYTATVTGAIAIASGDVTAITLTRGTVTIPISP